MRIKKYNNRKLRYDGKYVNLSEVVAAIKNGNEISAYRHDTEEDCTEEVLKEALKLVKIDWEILHELIKKGEMHEQEIE